MIAAESVARPVANHDLTAFATAISQLPSAAIAGDVRTAIRDADRHRRTNDPQWPGNRG